MSDNEDNAPSQGLRRSTRTRVQRNIYDEVEDDEPDIVEVRAPRRGTRNTSLPPPPPMQNKIFTALLDPQTSVQSLALDWLSDYKQDANHAVAEVINFLLKSCGCDIPVQPHDIVHPDSAAETFSPIEEKAKNHVGFEYAIVSRKVSKFRRSFEEFFMLIVENAAEDGILYYEGEEEENEEKENIIFALIKWFSPMSTAHLRSFRHTATVAVLSMMTQLCRLYKERLDQEVMLTAEVNELKNKKKSRKVSASEKNKISTAVEELEQRIQIENEKVNQISDAIQAAKNSVWQNRNKDIDPRIRVDCVKFLAQGIILAPERFVDTSSLRCFGSGLSDLEPSVRTNVLTVLLSLFDSLYDESESHANAKGVFSQFVLRYGNRIRQICQFDVEESARKSAVSLITILNKLEILEDEEETKNDEVLSQLIFDGDEKLRKEAANYFVSIVSKAVENLGIGDVALKKIQKAYPDFKSSWVIFKDIGDKFQDILAISEENETPDDVLLANWRFDSLPSRVSLASASICDLILRRKSLHLSWIDLSDQLLFDFSSHETPTIAKVNEGDITNYLQACNVDNYDLQIILLDVLYGFISSTIKSFSEPKKKRTQTQALDPQQAIDELNSHLIELIPKLLNKFSFSNLAVAKIIKLNSLIDLESGYVKLNKESVYDDISNIIINRFKTSSSDEITKEAELFFKNAFKDGSTFANEIEPKLVEVAEDFSFDIREKLSEIQFTEVSILESLSKLEKLGHIINIQDIIETPVQLPNDNSEILGKRLMDYALKFQTDGDIESDDMQGRISFVKIVINILRHYCISKFADSISPTASIISEETQIKNLETISYFIKSIEKLMISPNSLEEADDEEEEELPTMTNVGNDLRAFLQITLVDITISGWSAKIRGELLKQDNHIYSLLPEKFSNRIIKEIMWMFLYLEKVYLTLVDKPRNNIPDIDHLVGYNEEDDTLDINLSELQVEYLLCELASRIIISSSAGLWVNSSEYVKRLSSNKANISHRYINLVRDITRQLPTPPEDEESEDEDNDIDMIEHELVAHDNHQQMIID